MDPLSRDYTTQGYFMGTPLNDLRFGSSQGSGQGIRVQVLSSGLMVSGEGYRVSST